MNNLTFKRATTNNVETFIYLEKSVANLKVYSAITDEQEARKEIENNIVYFVKRDNELVGSIEYEMKGDDHAYLSGLIVHPDFQGQGIARDILKKILNDLKTVKRIDLITHPANNKAIMLYLSLGFVIESWKDNYFGDDEPRIVLALTR